MTNYKGQWKNADDTDSRPHVAITTNFTKPHTNFIAHMGGHLHADVIEYLKDFPDQLQMLISCGKSTYPMSDWDDLVRSDYGFVINYYVVNFDTKKLTVRRLGAKKTLTGYRVEQQFDIL